MKKINITPHTHFAEHVLPRPISSKKFIPNWYSEMNLFNDERNTYGIAKNNPVSANTTMKACMPFLDALTSGYMWYLPADLEIKISDLDLSFRWRTKNELITEHSKNQHPTLPSAFNGMDFVLKFSFDFVIETPKGYSTFFTHPINRHDLPFRTFSGIVDTDTYNMPIQFPFQILNFAKDTIIIEEGTPVCQFIPFKRDSWKMEYKKFNKIQSEKNTFNFKKTIKNSYKKNFWKKKEYN